MIRNLPLRAGCLVALAGLLLASAGSAQRIEIKPGPAPLKTPPRPATPEPAKFTPRFEALAETRLLMEGLAEANYRGLSKQLKNAPADNDTWVFLRGQALLIAETGNLLLLRPPRNSGRDTWMKLAMEMRDAAGNLARSAGTRDYPGSKTGLTALGDACNRCHTTFRIPVRITPDVEEPPREKLRAAR
jgi:hypothetical protein